MSTYSFSFFPRRCLMRYSLCPAWLENMACLMVLEVGLSHQDGDLSTLPKPVVKLLQWKRPNTFYINSTRSTSYSLCEKFGGRGFVLKCKLTQAWSWMWQSWPVRRQSSLWEWVEEEAEDWREYRRLCEEAEEGQEEAPWRPPSDSDDSSSPPLWECGWSCPQSQSLRQVFGLDLSKRTVERQRKENSIRQFSQSRAVLNSTVQYGFPRQYPQGTCVGVVWRHAVVEARNQSTGSFGRVDSRITGVSVPVGSLRGDGNRTSEGCGRDGLHCFGWCTFWLNCKRIRLSLMT